MLPNFGKHVDDVLSWREVEESRCLSASVVVEKLPLLEVCFAKRFHNTCTEYSEYMYMLLLLRQWLIIICCIIGPI